MGGGGGGRWERGGGWVKMSANRRREIFLKKHPKEVPRKRNLDQNIKNINDSKSRICNYFFENIILGVQLNSTRFSGHHQNFFTAEFVAENLKANKNRRERSLILQYSFTQKTSLILWISTLLKLKTICSHNSAKKLSQFTNFPANIFPFGVRKNIWTAPFPDAQELLSWNTLKPNVCIFLYISLRKFSFKDLARFYLVVWELGEAE